MSKNDINNFIEKLKTAKYDIPSNFNLNEEKKLIWEQLYVLQERIELCDNKISFLKELRQTMDNSLQNLAKLIIEDTKEVRNE